MSSTTKNLIDKIEVHFFPDLEILCFAGLLAIERVRRIWEVSSNHAWDFISSAKDLSGVLPDPTVMYFDVGGELGQDQHGDKRNAKDCNICSLEVLFERLHDVQRNRPWIRQIVEAVCRNDKRGKAISKSSVHLRELIVGMNVIYRQDPLHVLKWGQLAFQAIFAKARDVKGCNPVDFFNKDSLLTCVSEYFPQKYSEFVADVELAEEALKLHWQWSNDALQMAEKKNLTARVAVPGYGSATVIMVTPEIMNATRPVDALEHDQWPVKLGPASRTNRRWRQQRAYQVVIQYNPNGQFQVYTSTNNLSGGDKLAIHCGEMIAALRLAEVQACDLEIVDDDLTQSGFVQVRDEEGVISRLFMYLPEFLTIVLYGSNTAPDVPPSKLTPEEVFRLVLATLPRCKVLHERKGQDGDRQPIVASPRGVDLLRKIKRPGQIRPATRR